LFIYEKVIAGQECAIHHGLKAFKLCIFGEGDSIRG
jgi:hypothetical protein